MIARRIASLLGPLALAASTLVSARDASAQTPPIALNRFDPAPAGDRMFGVPSPFAAGHPGVHVMVLGEYAHNPLVIARRSTGDVVGALVAHQMFLHINATLALWHRLAINVDVPIALAQAGDSPAAAGQAYVSPSSAQFGDLRLNLRVRLFGEYHDPFQVGIGGSLWLPTGADNSFVSDKKVRGLPQAIIGGRAADRVVWSFAVGPEIRPGQTFAQTQQGTMLRMGAGFGVLLGDERQIQIGPEVSAALTLEGIEKRNINVEALVDFRARFLHDFEVGLGAGPGFSAGIGTPDFRGLLMLAYTQEQKKPVPDRDGDGIADDVDACPDTKGVASEDPKKHGCPPPPPDRDEDGVADDVDACPDEPGLPSEDPKKHGCPIPKDRDRDGILDKDDACPDEKGVPSEDPKKHGCPPPPPDRDHDGILDKDDACPDLAGMRTEDPRTNGCPDTDGDNILDPEDACPLEKGARDPDPKKNGCPVVHVIEGEIVILEQVQFDTGRSTIKKVSNPLLDKVAEVLKEHTEILKIEVQGHTDNKGLRVANKILSQNRAKAVMAALVKRGIDKKRMTAKGYGQEVPIADNKTAEGRQKNRRVQFKIVDKTKKAKKQ
jgi:OmpA-OmpF porin, OOP family